MLRLVERRHGPFGSDKIIFVHVAKVATRRACGNFRGPFKDLWTVNFVNV
jgi:hypothetical protein